MKTCRVHLPATPGRFLSRLEALGTRYVAGLVRLPNVTILETNRLPARPLSGTADRLRLPRRFHMSKRQSLRALADELRALVETLHTRWLERELERDFDRERGNPVTVCPRCGETRAVCQHCGEWLGPLPRPRHR